MTTPMPALPVAQENRLRWRICGLLFLAAVITYVDRQVFSILAPQLQREIGWSELDYGRIVIAFQVSYAAALALSGRLIDRIGARLGFTLAFVWWSITEMAHALAYNAVSFGAVRFVVGAGEGAIFPGAVKSIAELFPKRESGLATGILNCGPTVGAIVAPLVVPLVAAHYGWRGAFVLTGALGLVWLCAWLTLNRRAAGLTAGHREHASNGQKISWRLLLTRRQGWAYATGKILADPAWFFFLFWLPKFLARQHGLSGAALIPYLTTLYLFTGVGSVAGGSFSSWLIHKGWSVNRSRKLTLALSAVVMPIVIVAAQSHSAWMAVGLMAVALAAHQSWSSLVFTMGTDLFPSRAVGSATGMAGALGSVATILFAELTGRILQHNPGAYLPLFVACGLMYLTALGIIHLLVPRLEPLELDGKL